MANNLKYSSAAALRTSTAAGLVCGLLIVSPARADLRAVSGLNEVQRNLASTIHTICPGLAAKVNASTASAEETNLFIACNRMIQTSNALQGADSGTGNALPNVTEEQLVEALAEIDHEEVLAHSRNARDTAQQQLNGIAARLAALRSGRARPGAAGLTLNFGGQQWRAEDLFTALSGGAAGEDDSATGWFLNGGINFGSKDETSREEGYDFDTVSLTAGFDHRISETMIAGGAVGYAQSESRLDNNKDSADSEGYSASLFASWLSENGWNIDIFANFGQYDFTTVRDMSTVSGAINAQDAAPPDGNSLTSALPQKIRGDTEGTSTSLSLAISRDFTTGAHTFSPFSRVVWEKTDIDGYTEAGSSGLELDVAAQEPESLEWVLGFDWSKAVSTRQGVLTPQFRGEYHREFKDDGALIAANYTYDETKTVFLAPTDTADRNYFIFGAGVGLVTQGGWQSFLYYERTSDLKNMVSHVVTFGVRGEF